MNINNDFGKILAKYLKINKINQSDLALKLNVSNAAITKFLKTKNPREKTIKLILDALQVSEDVFYGNYIQYQVPKGKMLVEEEDWKEFMKYKVKTLTEDLKEKNAKLDELKVS